LPQAIFNYLLFLGWHPGITQEIFSAEEATRVFNFADLNARGAVYALEKLNWYNNYYIQQLELNEFSEYSWKILQKEYNLEPEKKEWVKKITLLFRPQLNYFQELINLTTYFFQRADKKIKEKENLWLKELRKELNKLEEWDTENIKTTLKSVCLNNQVSKKEFYSLARNLLTGRDKGLELVQIIYLLDKSEVEKRLQL